MERNGRRQLKLERKQIALRLLGRFEGASNTKWWKWCPPHPGCHCLQGPSMPSRAVAFLLPALPALEVPDDDDAFSTGPVCACTHSHVCASVHLFFTFAF